MRNLQLDGTAFIIDAHAQYIKIAKLYISCTSTKHTFADWINNKMWLVMMGCGIIFYGKCARRHASNYTAHKKWIKKQNTNYCMTKNNA